MIQSERRHESWMIPRSLPPITSLVGCQPENALCDAACWLDCGSSSHWCFSSCTVQVAPCWDWLHSSCLILCKADCTVHLRLHRSCQSGSGPALLQSPPRQHAALHQSSGLTHFSFKLSSKCIIFQDLSWKKFESQCEFSAFDQINDCLCKN